MTIFAILRRIKSDCTFNQNAFASRLTELQNKKQGHYYSIDLKAATDRMPIALQKRVVAYIFDSKEKSDA